MSTIKEETGNVSYFSAFSLLSDQTHTPSCMKDFNFEENNSYLDSCFSKRENNYEDFHKAKAETRKAKPNTTID